MEELGDLVSHKHWENQEKQTHAEATEVFPQTPGSTYEGEINEIGNKLKKEKKTAAALTCFVMHPVRE